MANRYILLPRSGLVPHDPIQSQAMASIFTNAILGRRMNFEALSNRAMTVLDSAQENGPKLVTLDDETAASINAVPGPLRAVPEVMYQLPREDAITILDNAVAVAGVAFTVKVQDQATGAPLAGVEVVAFESFAARRGSKSVTDANGIAQLSLPAGQMERLYVLAPAGYWGGYRANIPVANTVMKLTALDINYNDAIRTMYPQRLFNPATGVRVGVLDTGVGPNGEINVVGGKCTVTGKLANAYQDIDRHGTHVAGLIGGRGQGGTAVRGLAPGVATWAYRVFDFYGTSLGASNYAILKAMIDAQAQDIDILNLSLGGGPRDSIVEEAITDARNHGMLVVVAAGNDGRKAVSYPAAYPGATAVSAMGRRGTFPADSMDESSFLQPPNNPANAQDFIAAFSNVGPQISVTGLGVGVLSTLPGNTFGPMSGTSMAAPMVAGCAASLLSQRATVFGMGRDASRSAAIANLLQASCNRHFHDPNFEGYGLPDPQKV